MWVLHSDGKLARDTESENRFKKSKERSTAVVQNGTGEMALGVGLKYGLTHLISVMMPAMSNEMDVN